MENNNESIAKRLGFYLLMEGLIDKFNSDDMTQEEVNKEVQYIIENKLYEKYNQKGQQYGREKEIYL